MPAVSSFVASLRGHGAHAWGVAVAYVAAFALLDWVSYIRPLQGFNITPWNPQPALAIALLLANRRWLWLVGVSLLAAELAVRGLPANWFVTLASVSALTLVYAAIARALEGALESSVALADMRDLARFTAIVVPGALASGVVYVLIMASAATGPSGSLLAAIARYWVGDAVGLLVLLPMLLVLMDAQRRAALRVALARGGTWALALLIVALLAAVFGRDDRDHFKFFYLLLLPVVGASAWLGLAGAVLAAGLTQVGLIVGVQAVQNPDLTVFELQVLMAALTMTGLALGVAVDARARAEAELRGSLRMAAAGQMAAALAHELSQPLTALASYAHAARLLRPRVPPDDAAPGPVPAAPASPAASAAPAAPAAPAASAASAPGPLPVAAVAADAAARERVLADLVQRMAGDALRASEVVKQLRGFFRSGSTPLQPVPVAALLREAEAAQAARAEAAGVSLHTQVTGELPPVWMDRVQIAVVLRNLLANALDAASAAGVRGPVRLQAARAGDELRIDVLDPGGGVDAARLRAIFEPGSSDKPGGMGLGLSICRAIVEAHGGRLWAEPGAQGHFSFTLPLQAALAAEAAADEEDVR
ncbi:MAG: MASE1 domain-containing protein [Rubrivivax sp.]|nr:MASE1 domain-containing protein [Rubrivivax sp.]